MMKKENISIRRIETSIKLQASQINSIRVKDIERNAVRVYKDNKIGISGAVGSSSDEELTKQAIQNLTSNIPYPFELEANKKDHRDYTETRYSEEELMNITEKIIDSLTKDFDDFIFSESVKSMKIDYKLKNNKGLDLRYQDEYFEMGLIVKAKSSPNLFDTFVGFQGRDLDLEKFLAASKKQLTAERKKVELPKEEKVPVFFTSPDSLGQFLLRQLNGELYGNKASLFDNKLGEQLFNKKFTLVLNNDPKTSYSPFFDVEGVTIENDTLPLIENGVLKRVFTDKKNAAKFNLEHTGSASGGYDDIPSLTFTNVRVTTDTKDMHKVLNGKKAILVLVAAGGDFNADGHYATPVQASYLFDGNSILGKLPEFNMNNDLYSMLGKDYIGTFDTDHLYFGENQNMFGCYMNITK